MHEKKEKKKKEVRNVWIVRDMGEVSTARAEWGVDDDDG
jgi:hypothetical protein